MLETKPRSYQQSAQASSAVAVPVQSVDLCPKCGHELVRCIGKHGRYMGCSTWPECHFTREI